MFEQERVALVNCYNLVVPLHRRIIVCYIVKPSKRILTWLSKINQPQSFVVVSFFAFNVI